MLPDIGLMVGFYIITRMVDLTFRPDARRVTRVLGALTVVIAIIVCIDLILRGTTDFGLSDIAGAARQ